MAGYSVGSGKGSGGSYALASESAGRGYARAKAPMVDYSMLKPYVPKKDKDRRDDVYDFELFRSRYAPEPRLNIPVSPVVYDGSSMNVFGRYFASGKRAA